MRVMDLIVMSRIEQIKQYECKIDDKLLRLSNNLMYKVKYV